MEKKNWYENVNENVPVKNKNRHPLSFDAFDIFNLPSLPDDDFGLMKGLDGIGFQDKGTYYEMVTELGGNGDVKEDAVKIELTNPEDAYLGVGTVKVTYEHMVSTEHSSYSHSQATTVSLPEDADVDTISAHFDAENRVVVTVDKKVKKEKKHSRDIPITGRSK
jgi:hypothetical protein